MRRAKQLKTRLSEMKIARRARWINSLAKGFGLGKDKATYQRANEMLLHTFRLP